MDQRETFAAVASTILDAQPELAIVLADISTDLFADAARRHPDRVINVGIREQLQLGVAGGLALTGRRPIVHTYAPFLIERAYEQIKIDLDHQGVGAVLVSVGASYDASELGRTHFGPTDVALIGTLADWTVYAPGHPAEVAQAIRDAARGDGRVYVRLEARSNAHPHENVEVIRRGSAATVFAVGTTLDRVIDATAGMDVTLVYVNRPRPWPARRLRALTRTRDVVIVEPYLRGTSSVAVSDALRGEPHRYLSLGVGRVDRQLYGTPADHDRAHGLDVDGLRHAIDAFIR